MSIKNEIIEIALECIESDEMREHMRSADYLCVGDVICIIMTSRASLEDKISAIRIVSAKLQQIENGIDEWESESIQKAASECSSIIEIGQFALNEITDNTPAGTVFSLKYYYYDSIQTVLRWDKGHSTTFPYKSVLFTTFEAAKEYLFEFSKETEELVDGDADYIFESFEYIPDDASYTIEKWLPSQNGKMQLILEWHLNHEGMVWFAHINDIPGCVEKESLNVFDYYTVGWTITLRIPYKVGDIITIDRQPKQELKHAVIAEISNERDCCGIQVVHMEREFKVSSLSFLLNNQPIDPRQYIFPGLHRLSMFSGELPHYEAPLKKISEALKSNASLGRYGSIGKYLNEFNRDPINLLPEGIAVGDAVEIHCERFSMFSPDPYAVVAEINHETNNVEIIRSDGTKLWKANLASELGTINSFSFDKCAPDDIPYLLKKISVELKINPALANDKELLERR